MGSTYKSIFAVFAALLLAVPGSGQSCVWDDLPRFTSDVDTPWVHALKVFDDGTGPTLFVGGTFTTAGGVPASFIAKWDGTLFSPVGGGVDGAVHALEVFDDGTGPALYAAGNFASAGGVPANHIARWNGATWSTLGSGLEPGCSALAVFDDGTGPALYAGGSFTTAGGQPASRIARWNGIAWSPLGQGIGGSLVTAMCPYDDGSGLALYVGGYLGSAGGQPAWYVARWNAAGWSTFGGVGGGSYPGVNALHVYDDGSGPALYVGGHFTTAGLPVAPISASSVARWNGSWGTVGAGLLSAVDAFEVFDDGGGPELYELGAWTDATSTYIRRWNGTAWNGVGGGVPFVQGALQVFDDGTGPALFGGGRDISGLADYMFARWTCGAHPSLTLTQPGGPGAQCWLTASNLTPGRETYDVFSLELCAGGPGTGPLQYLGLCISTPANVDFILNQLLAPAGTPYHFVPADSHAIFGPFMVPPVTFDAVSFQFVGGAITGVSIPVRLTVH